MNEADTSKARLLDALNTVRITQAAFSDSTLTIGVPSAESGVGYDTVVEVTGKRARGYYGTVEIRYQRLALTELQSSPSTVFALQSAQEWTLGRIVNQLNAVYGARMTTDDIEYMGFAPLPDNGDTERKAIFARSTSLAWTGTIDIDFVNEPAELSAEVYDRELGGTLSHPGTTNELPSAEAMLYHMDFTAYREALLPNAAGTYCDVARLQDVTYRVGIPAWTAGQCTDHATSAVEGSNPAFDRVVVQADSGNPGLLGRMLFHYNTFDVNTAPGVIDATYNVDLGASPSAVTTVTLESHNLSTPSRVRIRGSNQSNLSDPVYDSDWLTVWPYGMDGYSLRDFSDPDFWLYNTDYVVALGESLTARYWRVEVSDPTNPATITISDVVID